MREMRTCEKSKTCENNLPLGEGPFRRMTDAKYCTRMATKLPAQEAAAPVALRRGPNSRGTVSGIHKTKQNRLLHSELHTWEKSESGPKRERASNFAAELFDASSELSKLFLTPRARRPANQLFC